jgi:hypothetical protein
VRDAAVALAIDRIHQLLKTPISPKGNLRVFSEGRNYSERRQLFLSALRGLILGSAGTIALCILLFLIVNQLSNTRQSTTTLGEIVSSPAGIAAIVIALILFLGVPILLILISGWWSDRLDEQIENYRKGQVGEDRVITALLLSLNGEWSLFRNIVLPGGKGGDMDGVLVGPNGVWVLEIKTLTGHYRNIGDRWEYRSGNRWLPSSNNPSKQAKQRAVALNNFLSADHLKVWVNPVVVWAKSESPLEIDNPIISVWKLDDLEKELAFIQQGKPLSEADRQKIGQKLERLLKPVK